MLRPTPQTDRIPGKSQSDHAVDLAAVIDRVTINSTRSGEEPSAIEPMYGKSATSPAHLAKAEWGETAGESPLGRLVAARAQADR
jgi:hypothetical protein